MKDLPRPSRARRPASRSPHRYSRKRRRMVDPSPQRGNSWTSRNSRKNYPNQAILGGEVGLWSSDLNALTAPETKEAVAEIGELGYRSEERRAGKGGGSRGLPYH